MKWLVLLCLNTGLKVVQQAAAVFGGAEQSEQGAVGAAGSREVLPSTVTVRNQSQASACTITSKIAPLTKLTYLAWPGGVTR